MQKQIHNQISQFLPQEHQIPKHSVGRVMIWVIGWMGILSIVGSFFWYNVDASWAGQDLVSVTSAPKAVVKKTSSIKANAGVDQTITLPASSVTLNGNTVAAPAVNVTVNNIPNIADLFRMSFSIFAFLCPSPEVTIR